MRWASVIAAGLCALVCLHGRVPAGRMGTWANGAVFALGLASPLSHHAGALVSSLVLAGVAPRWQKVCGDYDGDGDVDTADAVQSLRAAVALAAPDAQQVERCDIDADGRLEVGEALDVLRLAVGLGSASWSLPKVELVAENNGAKQSEVLGDSDALRAWVVRFQNSACFCQPFTTPVIFEPVRAEGWAETADVELVLVAGKLVRDQWGWHRIAEPVVEGRACVPSLPRLMGWAPLISAVASLDLGKVSHTTYAEATSGMCRSSSWVGEVVEALRGGMPQMVGASPDGRYVSFSVRGPRLPPLKSIVFRYLRVTVVYDRVQKTPARIVVDVEGWMEE